MKQLGPYRKYVTIAAIVQSVIVIVAGYLLFKSQAHRDPADAVTKKPHIEQTAPKTK